MKKESEEQQKTNSDALITQGQHLEDSGNLDEAEACYRRALSLASNPAKAHLNIGNVLLTKQLISDAQTEYLLTIKHDPSNGAAYANLGRINLVQDKLSEAEKNFSHAVDLLPLPEKAEAIVTLGYVLTQLKQDSQAEQAYRDAIAIVPDHPFANLQLGRLLMLKGKPVAATEYLKLATKMLPDDSNAHSWLGKTLSDQGFIPEACHEMSIAEKLAPQDEYNAGMHAFTLNYLPDLSSKSLYAAQIAYANSFFKPYYPNTKFFKHERNPDAPLKIGYVSSDFRMHPVSRFVEPILRHHNRQQFEVHCFYNNSNHDDTTQELISLADRWHTISNLSDTDTVKLIENLGIDLLIDLNGLTHGHRLSVFARKPAPIQLTWLGYLGTTGLKTMDYRICDFQTDPIGATEQFHTEELIRMPNSQWCHAPYKNLPPISELPRLKNGFITFGSFNNAAKLNDKVLNIWAQLLQSLPGSKIHFTAIPQGIAQQRILNIFKNYAIVSERIRFIPRQSYHTYLHAIGDVDIGLDPFPYNGGTTSFDTLIMGVPLVTLSGERSISRGGGSILSILDLPELITTSANEFLARAIKLAKSTNLLIELRTNLRNTLIHSPLMDSAQFTRDMEKIYKDCWREWCMSKG